VRLAIRAAVAKGHRRDALARFTLPLRAGVVVAVIVVADAVVAAGSGVAGTWGDPRDRQMGEKEIRPAPDAAVLGEDRRRDYLTRERTRRARAWRPVAAILRSSQQRRPQQQQPVVVSARQLRVSLRSPLSLSCTRAGRPLQPSRTHAQTTLHSRVTPGHYARNSRIPLPNSPFGKVGRPSVQAGSPLQRTLRCCPSLGRFRRVLT